MSNVETKVKASTGGGSFLAAVGGVVSYLLLRYALPKDMDPVVEGEIVAAIPTVLAGIGAFASGWLAPHTPRPVAAPPPPPITNQALS